ncbi:MAG: hypothetical protein J6J03_01170 [Tyzzerella sp.]|nr:hypothetical protein [Tyzzerella sp.]
MKKKYTISQIASILFLILGFILCRYILFRSHGMKEWPVVLFIIGVIVLGISIYRKKLYLPLFVSLGYPISWVIGAFTQSDSVDPGGGFTNNLWLTWMLSYVGIILVGIVFELISPKAKKLVCKVFSILMAVICLLSIIVLIATFFDNGGGGFLDLTSLVQYSAIVTAAWAGLFAFFAGKFGWKKK